MMIAKAQKLYLEDKSTVAFQGEAGAYSELTINCYLENGVAIAKNSFEAVFKALNDQTVKYAIVPVSNTIAGKVDGIEELMQTYQPKIIYEIQVAIEHCLIVNPGTKAIKSVYSHIQALKQCQRFIKQNDLIQIPYYDTAGAVKMIKEEKLLDAGAIASRLAAQIYSMDVLIPNLGLMDNVTTFYLIQIRK